MAELRDRQTLFQALSIGQYQSASIAENSFNGWSLSNFTPNRVFTPVNPTNAQLAVALKTLILDLFGR